MKTLHGDARDNVHCEVIRPATASVLVVNITTLRRMIDEKVGIMLSLVLESSNRTCTSFTPAV